MGGVLVAARRNAGLLVLVLLVDASFAATFLVALHEYLPEELGASRALPGLTLAGFGLAKLVVQPFAGLLVDRGSVVLAAYVGLVLCGVAGAGMALGVNPAFFPSLGGAYGAGSAIVWPALYSSAASASDSGGRSQLTAALAVTTGLAVAVALGIGALVVDFVSGRALVGLSALGVAAALLLAPLFLRAPTGSGRTAPQRAPVPRAGASIGARTVAGAFVFLQAAAVAGLVPLAGPFARDQLGLEFHVAVIHLAPAGLGAVAGLLAGVRLADRAGRLPVVAGGLGVSAAGAALLASSGTAVVATGATGLLLAGYGAAFPAVSGTIMDFSGTLHRGTVIGWFMSAEGLGHAAGPAATGLIIGSLAPQAGVLLAAALFAGAALLAAAVAGARRPGRVPSIAGTGTEFGTMPAAD